ncbi:MAG: MaoC family dehydratase [Pseudomonadota bacterium]
MNVKPHDRFAQTYQLDAALVSSQALAVGDDNPIHHDPIFAAQTRYKRPIASGTHTTALLLGLTASHFSKANSMVGLDYWVGFKRPIYAHEKIRMEWLVVRVTPNKKLGGKIVELRGRILGEDGKTSVGAKGRLLVTEQL